MLSLAVSALVNLSFFSLILVYHFSWHCRERLGPQADRGPEGDRARHRSRWIVSAKASGRNASLRLLPDRNTPIDGAHVPPLLAPGVPKAPYDWNTNTTVQPGLNGRAIHYQRGKVLGGSSAVSEYNVGSRCQRLADELVQLTRSSRTDPKTTTTTMPSSPATLAGTGTTCKSTWAR